MKRLLPRGAVFLLFLALQFAAYSLGRPAGDYAFLLLALMVAVLAGSMVRSLSNTLLRMFAAGLLGASGFYALASFALWVRGPVLGLTDNHSHSALAGIVLAVGAACTLLSCVVGAFNRSARA
jgi:hypothetical protein